MLRWITAGESHGPELIGVIEGLPAGVPVLAVHPRGPSADELLHLIDGGHGGVSDAGALAGP